MAISHHITEFSFFHQFECFYAEFGSQYAIEGDGCATALQVTEDGNSDIVFDAEVSQFLFQLVAYTT